MISDSSGYQELLRKMKEIEDEDYEGGDEGDDDPGKDEPMDEDHPEPAAEAEGMAGDAPEPAEAEGAKKDERVTQCDWLL